MNTVFGRMNPNISITIFQCSKSLWWLTNQPPSITPICSGPYCSYRRRVNLYMGLNNEEKVEKVDTPFVPSYS